MDDNQTAYTAGTGPNPSPPQASDDQPINIAILVLGILGIVFVFFLPIGGPLIALVCSIVGLVLGTKQRKLGNTSGLVQAGWVMSIIGLSISGLMLILFISLVAFGLSVAGGLLGHVAHAGPWFF